VEPASPTAPAKLPRYLMNRRRLILSLATFTNFCSDAGMDTHFWPHLEICPSPYAINQISRCPVFVCASNAGKGVRREPVRGSFPAGHKASSKWALREDPVVRRWLLRASGKRGKSEVTESDYLTSLEQYVEFVGMSPSGIDRSVTDRAEC